MTFDSNTLGSMHICSQVDSVSKHGRQQACTSAADRMASANMRQSACSSRKVRINTPRAMALQISSDVGKPITAGGKAPAYRG